MIEKLGQMLQQATYSFYELIYILWNKLNDVIDGINTNVAEVSRHENSGDHDDRYYTENEIESKLKNKTDLTGDHKGTWNGLKPSQVDVTQGALLEKHDGQLSDRIGLNQYPRLNIETNDRGRLQRAFADISEGKVLYIPNGTYDLGGSDFIIDKRVHILGEVSPFYDFISNMFLGGVLFINGGIDIQSRGLKISQIGINNTSTYDGFMVNKKQVDNVTIEKCIVKTVQHCYLTESYNGLVENITIKECLAVGGIHGFISKAKGVKHINCYAQNISSYAFGYISDNMAGINKNAECIDNIVENCVSYNNNISFIFYARDYQNANNVTVTKGHILTNLKSLYSTTGLIIGSAGGQGYTVLTPKDIIINNLYIDTMGKANAGGYEIDIADNITIDNLFCNAGSVYTNYNCKNVRINILNSDVNRLSTAFDIITINNNQPTVDISSTANKTPIIRFQNTAATIITDFINSKDGDMIYIQFNDDLTKLQSSATIALLKVSEYSGKNSWVLLKKQGTGWLEVNGYNAYNYQTKKVWLGGGAKLGGSKNYIITSNGSETTANKITLDTNIPYGDIITIIVTSGGGTYNYGGFDTNQFIIPASIRTSIVAGTAQGSQWVYDSSSSKWWAINIFDVKNA
jgi:hypothetical protein